MLLKKHYQFLTVIVSTLICLVFQNVTNLRSQTIQEQKSKEKDTYSMQLVPWLGSFEINMFKKNEEVFPVTVKATSSQDVTNKYEVLLNDSIVGASAEVEMEDGNILFVEFIREKDEIKIKTKPKKTEVGQSIPVKKRSVGNKMVWCSTRIFMDLSGKKLIMGIIYDDTENYRIGFIPVYF